MYVFCQKDYKLPVSSEEISHFLKQISKTHEYWQVQQASNAIHTYNFYLRRNKLGNQKHNAEPDELWRTVADDMMRMIRLRHLYFSDGKNLSWLAAIVL